MGLTFNVPPQVEKLEEKGMLPPTPLALSTALFTNIFERG
jgi:hypothetical protein